MPTHKNSYYRKFLKWRYKNISEKNFVLILSAIVGLLAGLASVTLKNITYSVSSMLEHGIIFSENQLYFILPFIGLLLVYLSKKILLRNGLRPAIPSFIKRAIPSLLYSLLRQNGMLSYKLIYHPLIMAPLTVG
ncbi:MAG TPA: chloride channel protein, partial [Arenibacter sp.]|nr:chloride channel protein [Arenibacter sp.]